MGVLKQRQVSTPSSIKPKCDELSIKKTTNNYELIKDYPFICILILLTNLNNYNDTFERKTFFSTITHETRYEIEKFISNDVILVVFN